MTEKPLSDAVRQGWAVVGYTVTDSGGEAWKHNFLLSRQGQHKVLTIRKKMMGEGVVASENGSLMSVRRLAKVQPASFAFSKATKAKADWWIAKYPENRRQSAVIPILWLVQKQEGWCPEPALRAIGELLAVPYIRVLEVATFYTMFMLEPVGTSALIQVCGTTPCALRGAGDLMDVCKKKIGPKDTLSADGRFTWQEVECLGACANAPMAQINDYYFEDLTAETMGQIIDDFAAGKTPKPGSRVGRASSEPEGGALTLTDPKLYDGSAGKKIKKLPNSDPVPA